MPKLQCPNPVCGSFNINTSRTSVTLQIDPISKFITRPITVSVLTWLVLLGPVTQAVAHFSLLSDILAPFGLGWLVWAPLVLLVVYLYFYLKIPRQKAISYKCSTCKYSWFQPQPEPGQAKSLQKQMEIELVAARKIKSRTRIGIALITLAEMYGKHYDNWQQAVIYAQEGADLLQADDNKRAAALSLNSWGWCLIHVGEWQRAVPMLERSLSMARELKDWQIYRAIINSLGMALLYSGYYEPARQCLEESLQFCMKMNATTETLSADIEGLAGVALGQGQPIKAAQFCGAAKKLREMSGEIPSLTDHRYFQQMVQATRAQLDPTTFETAWQEGANLTIDQLAEYNNRTLEAVG